MTFKATFSDEKPFNASFSSESAMKAVFSSTQTVMPSYVLQNTTEAWNSTPQLIGALNTIYVYVDHQIKTDEEGNEIWIPGIKIGDGKAYLIDLPFTDSAMVEHTENASIHVTPEEKDFWNNKVRCYVSPEDSERLVFTTN